LAAKLLKRDGNHFKDAATKEEMTVKKMKSV
jgi:hypothetical protein